MTKPIDLSADGISKLMGIKEVPMLLPDEGKKDADFVFEAHEKPDGEVVVTRFEKFEPIGPCKKDGEWTHIMIKKVPQCPFTPIEGPIDPRKPFGDLESRDLMGSYVTRDDKEIEVLVEIKDYQPEWEGVTLGNCFTPRGEYIDLTPEEQQRMEKEFERGLSA